MNLGTSSTTALHGELNWLRGRYDCGAVAPAAHRHCLRTGREVGPSRYRGVQGRRGSAATPRKALRVRANDIAGEICLVVGTLALTDIVGGRRPVRRWTY